MANDKYELLLDDTVKVSGRTLYRIRALKSFGKVKAGDLGGYVESEKNLDFRGNSWVGGDAKVYDRAAVYRNANVFGDASVYGYAEVYENALVHGSAEVYGNAWVYGNAKVFGWAQVYGDAKVYGDTSVWNKASVSGKAKVYGDARVGGKVKISKGDYKEGDVEESESNELDFKRKKIDVKGLDDVDFSGIKFYKGK